MTILFRPFSTLALLRLLLFVTILLPRPGLAADLNGTVVDPDGRPVPNARVLLSRAGAVSATTTTDAQGRFGMVLAAGRYEVRASVPGFRSDVVPLDVGADDLLRITIALRVSAIEESVVVSASPVDRPLSRTPDSVTVIDADELRAHQVETVSDALRLVPGLTVTQSGGRGGVTSLFPRGGESNFTLVLIDGVRANAFGGGFDFAHLPIADIDRIEIVRGPQSALYGSDAIGSVVQIVTRRGGPTRTAGLVEGGGFGTTRAAGSVAGSHNGWSWGAAGERLDTDGFTGEAPDTGEPVTNDDYRRTDGSFNLGWEGGRDVAIRGTGRLSAFERGFPGPFGSDPLANVSAIDTVSRGENDIRLFSVDAEFPWSQRVTQDIQIAWSGLDGTFTSPFGTSESESRRVTVRGQADAALLPRMGLSIGGELLRESAESTFITGPSADRVPVERSALGVFGELRYDAGDRLYLTAGARVERIHRDALAPDPNAFSPRPRFDASTVVSTNPKLTVAYFLQPPGRRERRWTRVHGSVGTGIRPPDAFEIAFTDNPSLEPERNRSFDIGVEQTFAGGAFIVDATGFYNRYDDLIITVGRSFQDASQFRTDNISNARARGLELVASTRTSWGLAATLTYTWLDTDVLAVDQSDAAPPPFDVGEPLIRRPRHQGAVDLVYRRGPVTAFGQVLARGQNLDVEPSFGAFGGLYTNPGYGVVNLGGTIAVRRELEVFARITNLLDRAYEATFGFPALGRSAIVGVRVAAGY
ncbi:MAG: TonB-dependent receptor [Vicinamibacterales bacterium]|jgi:outer membrane cobalamin receptor|nr:hypothetical protein [Acidobacteriota bacterium]MDP6373844.1 TonB-dependent receptor [Vicinamibacterales bacterium]MDP6607761.1 TonB-dependent receptor [Vicinamibacterales bacterium]HAK56517.1 hypothetical protein [Acidobacteriota bacterium]|tara:strand:- start:7423 stop:9693 length:2271 start_codon:yes stop_codon:yes gene_type:complete